MTGRRSHGRLSALNGVVHQGIVLPHLGLGGAQRVASCMATHWTECGHKVTVVTLMDTPPDFHRLDPRVERVRLPRPNGRLVRARRSLAARIERSDLSADRVSTPDSNPRRGEHRRLDGLRAAYRSLLRLLATTVAFITRHRLLGRSREVYACGSRIPNSVAKSRPGTPLRGA